MAEMSGRQRQGSSEQQQQDHHNYRGHPALAAGRRASTEDIVVTDRPRQHRQLSVTSGRSHRPASLSPFRPPKNDPVVVEPVDNSSSSSSGLFNWRKRYNARRSSSSCVTPLAPAVQQQQASSNVRSAASGTSSRRMSQPAAFSLPQLVRRSLQPLISSSPSTDVDDVQADSVSKLRYMKCKQV